MTIVTKALTGEKKPDVQPLVADGGDVEKSAKDIDATAGLNERYHYILRTRAARVSSATTLCLLITALLVMTVGLFGGLYVYRQMTRSRFQKLWCNVPLDTPFADSRVFKNDDDLASPLFSIPQLEQNGLRKIDDDGLTYLFGEDPKADTYFRENFELDMDDEAFSKIDVPDFKNGRMGRFIHEFDSNKTAIVDQSTKRCFIMPLDREKVSPPKTMFDMIQKMSAGYYSVNTHRVRETMRVVLPALEDLSDLGDYIKEECKDKMTYRLEKSTNRVIKKRSIMELEKPYTEFAGMATIEYHIDNLAALS